MVARGRMSANICSWHCDGSGWRRGYSRGLHQNGCGQNNYIRVGWQDRRRDIVRWNFYERLGRNRPTVADCRGNHQMRCANNLFKTIMSIDIFQECSGFVRAKRIAGSARFRHLQNVLFSFPRSCVRWELSGNVGAPMLQLRCDIVRLECRVWGPADPPVMARERRWADGSCVYARFCSRSDVSAEICHLPCWHCTSDRRYAS